MSKLDNIEDFENLFKEGASKASAPAPSGVWEGVSSGIGSSSSGISSVASYFTSVSNIIKAALFVGGISAVVGILYQANTQDTQVNIPTEIVDENQLPEVVTEDAMPNESENDNASITENTSSKKTASNATNNDLSNNDISSNSETNTNGNLDITPQNPASKDNPSNNEVPTNMDMPQLILSKNSACKGDKITVKTNISEVGTWYANNKEIAKDKAEINYTITGDKSINFTFKSDKRTIIKTVNVVSASSNLVKEIKSDGSYVLKLNNKQTIGNWYIDNKLIATNANQIPYHFKTVGKHTIKVIPVNEKCAEILKDVVEVEAKGSIFIPNVLTPDGDGKNDTYKVKIENYVNFSLQIYDLNSRLVFATIDPNIGWNGKLNNADNQCTTGNYAGRLRYQLVGEEPVIKNIKITLITN